MENSAETTCRVCLKVIDNEMFIVIEETILHLLNLTVRDEMKPVVCVTCSKKLFEAHHFKTACMDTEDNITSHINSESITPVDLRDIYLKINGNEHLGTIMADEQICRLCMHIDTSGFTSVEHVEPDIIQICIPDINFSSTVDPVICAACLRSLNAHNSFLKHCLEPKEQIKSFNKHKDTSLHIKVEELEIKSEKNEEDSNDHKRNLTGYMSERTLYNCDSDDYKIKSNGDLDINQFKHKNPLEVSTFQCHLCDFTSKYKSNLSRHHQVKHENTSNLQLYECDVCDFKINRKDNLKKHQLKHKNPSEVQMYICDMCEYKTKFKFHFTRHQLIHKNSSKSQIDTCDFQTKGPKMYDCGICSYKTKFTSNISKHRLKHKDPSQVQMYLCDKCSYKTKRKDNLRAHILRHKEPSEIQLYKCNTCGFKTRLKGNLKAHVLTHKDRTEMLLYPCDTSAFENDKQAVFYDEQSCTTSTNTQAFVKYECDV